MLVEWGPVVGGLALLGLAVWFVSALWYGGHVADARPRRIVLLGLLAVALHNTADFALEFIGVAAPACALAGALSPARWIDWRPARARTVGVVALIAAIAVGAWAAPGTWSHRTHRNDELAAGSIGQAELLATRPLDAALHTAIARALLDAGHLEDALARATIATRLRPGGMEGWLVRSDAAARLGDAEEADVSIRHALAEVHVPPGQPLVEYLVARYPKPSSLAAVAPTEALPWRLLVRALEPVSPAHADAVARLRSELDPTDPEPLVYRARFALALGNFALSLHHARLLRQAAPELAGSHLAVAAALAGMGGREAEIVETLESALAEAPLADDAERGRVEEQLVRVLLSRRDAPSLARAREVAPDLVARPGSREVRQRRRELAKALADR
jgi:tetratricopeptide (TPR) repeat protein